MGVDLICTIGPASSSSAVLKELLQSGMTIARLNMSHSSHEEHQEVINVLRAASAESGKPVKIMGDLQGPKIRLKSVQGEAVQVAEGQPFILDHADEPGGRERAALDNASVIEDIQVGATILINDGEVRLEVTDKKPGSLTTRVTVGGTIGSRKGVNVPGTRLRLPAITAKDKQDLQFLLEQQVDWIACSFIREEAHLEEIREFIASLGQYQQPGLISKIETVHAVLNFASIMKASDGIMVARGDLGVELPFEQIPFIQKALLHECRISKTYAITATHMLQSMTEHPVPTRAEVTDIAQAVMDGSDAVMLSAESSVGKFPVQSTRVMDTIAKFAEKMSIEENRGEASHAFTLERIYRQPPFNKA